MGVIKNLTDSTINRIAAGEVIERPASVVKELVENAIDSGALKIDITLERAGKNLIIVSDDGVGMTSEDLELAVERHTTSKLNEEDIMNISTFGFRGEALPSIGAVSKMNIITKHQDADHACEVSIHGGIKSTVNLSYKMQYAGTRVEVRDLFFSTPARLKFLRSDRTEYIACHDVVKKLAIAHPQINFIFTHDNKKVLKIRKNLSVSTEFADIKRLRIEEILSTEFMRNSLEVNLEREQVSVSGFVSLPTYNKASAEDLLLLVNNRPVKDKLLMSAVRAAYQGVLARDRYPAGVIFLDIDPYAVDVNVHPTKSEVRFHNPSLVRGVMVSAIRNVLLDTSKIITSIPPSDASKYFKAVHDSHYANDTKQQLELLSNNMLSGIHNTNNSHSQEKGSSTQGAQSLNYSNADSTSKMVEGNVEEYYKTYQTDNTHNNTNYNAQQTNNKKYNIDSSYARDNIENTDCNRHVTIDTNNDSNKSIFQNIAKKNTDTPILATDKTILNDIQGNSAIGALGQACAQLHGNYIIAQTTNGLVIVDQHAAHERIVYENLRNSFQSDNIIRQKLLIAEIVNLTDAARVDKICDHIQEILSLGMLFEKYSDKQIKVLEIPSLLDSMNVHSIVNDIADYLIASEEHILLADMAEKVLQSYSCYHSVRSGHHLSVTEMNIILRQIEITINSGQCNHGRPTYIKFDLKDIEKLFGRR